MMRKIRIIGVLFYNVRGSITVLIFLKYLFAFMPLSLYPCTYICIHALMFAPKFILAPMSIYAPMFELMHLCLLFH